MPTIQEKHHHQQKFLFSFFLFLIERFNFQIFVSLSFVLYLLLTRPLDYGINLIFFFFKDSFFLIHFDFFYWFTEIKHCFFLLSFNYRCSNECNSFCYFFISFKTKKIHKRSVYVRYTHTLTHKNTQIKSKRSRRFTSYSFFVYSMAIWKKKLTKIFSKMLKNKCYFFSSVFIYENGKYNICLSEECLFVKIYYFQQESHLRDFYL